MLQKELIPEGIIPAPADPHTISNEKKQAVGTSNTSGRKKRRPQEGEAEERFDWALSQAGGAAELRKLEETVKKEEGAIGRRVLVIFWNINQLI